MSQTHTIRIEQGTVSTPAQANQNPSIASSPNEAKGISTIGVALKAAGVIQAAQLITSNTISNIGFVTGDYELQEKAEALTAITGIGIGLIVAPIPTAVALTVKGSFDLYKTRITQNRNIYKQQQQQVLTGKISTNGGVWL